VHTVSGLAIGIGVGSGAGGVLVVLIALVVTQKLKRRRKEMLKRTFFEQNRGRLLQQLVSQRTDIAERMIIPLAELEKATNNLDRTHELGGGGHGTVYKGILSNLHVVAIKKPKMVIQREIDEFINEVAILSQINHRHVVKLYGCCLETEVPMLVYEFISNGTLSDHLHINEPKSLPWDVRLRIATETAKSLAYLHMTVSTPIIHRDIKSANILLDNTLAAKVADFGASRYIPVDKTGVTTMVQGTRGYLDPMYLSTGRLTEKSDVYSFGVMLIELLTRKKPFSYFSSEGEGLVGHFATLFAEGNFSQILDPQVVDTEGKVVEEVAKLALACVKLAGEDRPTMRDVELTLEGLKPSKRHVLGSAVVEASKEDAASTSVLPSTCLPNRKESSRQYSMEEEFLLSAKYPR
jgi:serine/threonine protein kinase